MDVVLSFGSKVGVMVDNQRADFMTAYEHHIIDVQRELQSLREKVAVIESDATLKAKLDTLDSNQKKFKEEALNLDSESLDLRKKLRKLVGILHACEKERDWYLNKLRQAKNRFNYLLEERAKYGGDGLDTCSLYSGSNDSRYSLHIQRASGTNVGDLKARIQGVYGVSRDQALLQTLPRIAPPNTAGGTDLVRAGMIQSRSPSKNRSSEERQALAELVALKSRQEAIRDFVAQCASSCDKGPWSRVPRRPISELLGVCEDVASQSDDETTEQERLLLAFELAAIPETYNAISDLLAGRNADQNITRGLQWPALKSGENAFHVEGLEGRPFVDGFFNDGDQADVTHEPHLGSFGAGEFTEMFGNQEGETTNTERDDGRFLDNDLVEYLAKLKKDREKAMDYAESDSFMRFD